MKLPRHIQEAVKAIRDPDGTGRTEVSHGWGDDLKPVAPLPPPSVEEEKDPDAVCSFTHDVTNAQFAELKAAGFMPMLRWIDKRTYYRGKGKLWWTEDALAHARRKGKK